MFITLPVENKILIEVKLAHYTYFSLISFFDLFLKKVSILLNIFWLFPIINITRIVSCCSEMLKWISRILKRNYEDAKNN